MEKDYDLRTLPKMRDGLTYAYFERCKVEQDALSVSIFDADGKIQLPVAALGALFLGPGVSVTSAAVKTLADNGCIIVWVGEGLVRCYASGLGKTRKSKHLERQATCWANENLHKQVVNRMYRIRFNDLPSASLSLEQLRGMEGVRVRQSYAQASRKYNVPWNGRNYSRDNWSYSDPINQALSTANSCLYGICHAAIIVGGYSPALGFIHTGKALSFVYDIADLYKSEITIPVAFHATSIFNNSLSSEVRRICRTAFQKQKLLKRILPDIDRIFNTSDSKDDFGWDIDEDVTRPTPYWEPTVSTNSPEDEW